MPWKPLPRIAFAIAIYPFSASSPADLPLELGDELYIIEQGGADGSWYRGYLVAPPSLLAGLTCVKGQTLEARVFSGIFPRCCVEIRELLGDSGAEGDTRSNGPDYEHQGALNASDKTRREPKPVRIKTGVFGNGSNRASGRAQSPAWNGNSLQDSGIGNTPSRSSSFRKPHKVNGDKLTRKLSQRSIKSQISVGSSLPLASSEHGLKRPPAPVPMLKIGDETPTSSSEPLVDEIASCLREWHSKNLHELLLNRRYSVLERIWELVYQLDLSRRQILHGVHTAQELDAQREKTVWDLVRGNKMLSNEIIVRDPEQRGRLLIGDDSAIKLTKLQSVMSLLDHTPVPQHDPINRFHVMIDIKAFAKCGLYKPSISVSLFARKSGDDARQLTESYTIDVPANDQFDSAVTSGILQTLFTDLSSVDIGENPRSGSNLYLVIKLQATVSTISPTGSSRKTALLDLDHPVASSTASVSSNSPSVKAGRKSLMWSPKQFGSVRHRNQHDFKSSQASSAANSRKASQSNSEGNSRPDSRPGPREVKRNVGIGALDVKNLLGRKTALEKTIPMWSRADTTPEAQDQSDQPELSVRDMIFNANDHLEKCKALDNIRLSLQCFESADAEVLIKKTPTLFQNIAQTPKIGFSGAPTRSRSDIYLTLSEAYLPPQALLSHPERGTVPLAANPELRNIQLTLEVRRQSGERIAHSIFPSSSSPGLTVWRTSAASRGEPWNQLIKLVIPSEDVPNAHIIMSIADAPNFPFALGWMPLWEDGAFIRDGPHTPLLYLYDKLTSNAENGRGAYLDLPWNSRGRDDVSKDETLTGPVSLLRLETFLCSTTFSQDKALLGILKWRDRPKSEILDLLKRFPFVSEAEIVKLVNDVFDALFGILVDNSGNEEAEDLVFDALVTVLGIVYDRRFNLGPLVDRYAETRFDHPFATPCLMRSYLRLLANPFDNANPRRLRATLKVGRQMLKFIISAREKQKIKEAGIGITMTQPTFSRDLKNIFKALKALMQDESPVSIGNKTLVVQHMHTWLPELQHSFSEEEIFDIAASFLDACGNVQSKLILYKLVFILNLNTMKLFTEVTRNRLTANTVRWIDPYWGSNNGYTDQWREQVRLCCSIVSSQMEKFGIGAPEYFVKIIESYRSLQAADRARRDQVSLLFPTAYPFVNKPISSPPHFDEALTELAAVLAQLAQSSLINHLSQSPLELSDKLFAGLDVIQSILSEGAFPSAWLSLYVYHHRSSLNLLESFFQLMIPHFVPAPEDADNFNTELWSKFLLTLLTLVRSGTLALETFAEQKRRAVWKIAGDVREQGADLLQRSWDAIGWESSPDDQNRYGIARLGGYQVQYVPNLVSPVVELCLSVHEGLRSVAVRILQTMIASEWTLSEDLSVIQAEMINCLDLMFKSKNIIEGSLQKVFVDELLSLFEPLSRQPGDDLWDAVRGLVSVVDELLDLLGAVHSPDQTESSRIMHTLQLMDFLKGMRKEDMFASYVHQLATVQAQLHNPTEAGLALQLHADLYAWDKTVVEKLADPLFPEQSSFERKEQLYFEMIKLYEEGMAWESALACYRELADQYEHHLYDFAKLARTQRSMAKIYEAISKGGRQPSRYFRVVYKGLGFSPNLRDKQFIFEASVGERQSTFTDRMRQQHPSAQIVSSGDTEDVEGQYLQISTVSPHRDLKHRVYQQSRVSQSIREYLLLSSQSDRFAVTSKRHSPTAEISDQWVEKTVYHTKEGFPNILRRSEITSSSLIRLSPLETAVERTIRKTSELGSFEKRMQEGDESSLESLIDAVQASTDPLSTSTVAKYRRLIPEPPESEDNDSVDIPPLDPVQNSLRLALIDHASALKHCLSVLSRSNVDTTSLSEALSRSFAPELAILNPQLDPPPPPIPTISQPASPPLTPANPAHPSPDTTPFLQNGNPISPPPQSSTEIRPKAAARLGLGFLKTPSSKSTAPTTNGHARSPHPLPSTNPIIDTASEARASIDGSSAAKSIVSEDPRPGTAVSGRSSKVKKRLSLLGIGRGGSREGEHGRVKGGVGVGGMGGVAEEG